VERPLIESEEETDCLLPYLTLLESLISNKDLVNLPDSPQVVTIFGGEKIFLLLEIYQSVLEGKQKQDLSADQAAVMIGITVYE
jgi:hypothetical protein